MVYLFGIGGITNQNEKTVYRNMEHNMPNRFIQTEYNNINVQFHSIWYIRNLLLMLPPVIFGCCSC